MGVVATFNYAAWAALYPEFSNVSQNQAQGFFDQATIFHRNDGGGPVSTIAIQLSLLNMLTAHLAFMSMGTAAQPASQLVGRISNASEGSVSVQAEYADATPSSMAWYVATKYGAAYWQATAPYRTMRYIGGPTRQFSPLVYR